MYEASKQYITVHFVPLTPPPLIGINRKIIYWEFWVYFQNLENKFDSPIQLFFFFFLVKIITIIWYLEDEKVYHQKSHDQQFFFSLPHVNLALVACNAKWGRFLGKYWADDEPFFRRVTNTVSENHWKELK